MGAGAHSVVVLSELWITKVYLDMKKVSSFQKIGEATLGIVVIAVTAVKKIKEMAISFVSQLFSSSVQSSQLAGIGVICGLLLLPFQSHRATAASPSDDTVETQAIQLLPILIKTGYNALGSAAFWAALKGTEYIIEDAQRNSRCRHRYRPR